MTLDVFQNSYRFGRPNMSMEIQNSMKSLYYLEFHASLAICMNVNIYLINHFTNIANLRYENLTTVFVRQFQFSIILVNNKSQERTFVRTPLFILQFLLKFYRKGFHKYLLHNSDYRLYLSTRKSTLHKGINKFSMYPRNHYKGFAGIQYGILSFICI